MKTRLLVFMRLLVHSSVSLSLGGASVANLGAALEGRLPSWRTLIIAFCCTYAVYNFDRLADRSGMDGTTTPQRAQAMRAYRRGLWGSVILALAVALALALTHSLLAVALTLSFPLSVILYVLPILPLSRFPRLKDIPLLKSFYVPACWTLLVLLGNAIAQIPLGSPGSIISLAFMFFRMLVSASHGDVRDYEADKQAGTTTLAVALGLPATTALLHTLNVASIIAIALAGLAGLGQGTLGLIPAVAMAMVAGFYFLNRPLQREFWGHVYDVELVMCTPLVLLAAAL